MYAALRRGTIVVWIACSAVRAVPAQAGTEELLARAAADLTAGRFAAAEIVYRELAARQPGLIDAHRGLSRALAAQQRRSEAAAVLGGLGEGLLGAGRHAAAAEVLGEAAELAAADPRLQALLGKARLFAQSPQAAIAPLERARELGDASLLTRLYLAAALWESGRPEAAERLYRELVAGAAGPFAAVHQLGRLLLWQGRFAEAAPLLERAAAERPAAADVRFDLAQALAGAGELDGALAAYRRTVELSPGHYKAFYGLARVLARLGGQDAAAREALATYQRLYAAEQEATRRENLERARFDRGWKAIEDGAYREAIGLFERLGASPEAFAGTAAAWTLLGDPARAAVYLERAVALAPEREDLRRLLAEARLAAGGDT